MPRDGDDRGTGGRPAAQPAGADLAVRVTLPEEGAEIAGAILMELLGPFELQAAKWTPPAGMPVAELPVWGGGAGGAAPTGAPPGFVALVFYPPAETLIDEAELLAALPEELRTSGHVTLTTEDIPRDWIEGWRDHFKPVVIGEVRVRPPWEEPAEPDGPLVDVVINPGLAFGTGLHPTTRGTLTLLQEAGDPGGGCVSCGSVVDAGTGSGILAIAAAKLGWGPVFAFDSDAVALASARENVVENGVAGIVEMHQTDIEGASLFWFSGATVLANMTLDPVLLLLQKLAPLSRQWGCSGDAASVRWPERLIVSGILAGGQEFKVVGAGRLAGFKPVRTICEGEWVSMEFVPSRPRVSAERLWG